MARCVAACWPRGDCCVAIRFAAADTIRFRKGFGRVVEPTASVVILSEERSDESKDPYRFKEFRES